MTPHVRHLTTEGQRERFHEARRAGGMCAACGRTLRSDEVVYVEPFTLGPADGWATGAYGPVGQECAAPEFVMQTVDREPERCVGCSRPMYYRVAHARRQQAVCSRRCRGQSVAARHRQTELVREGRGE
jgi:hypothetical protein